MAVGLALLVVSGCAAAGDAPSLGADEEEVVHAEKPSNRSGPATTDGGGDAELEEEPEGNPPEIDEDIDFGQPMTSERGLLIKEVGQFAGFADEEDRDTVRFVLTDIAVNPPCTAEHVDEPENGNYLALHFDVETFAELAGTGEIFQISAHDFRVWNEDGTRVNDPRPWGSCLPAKEMLPADFGPADKASGWVLLDVPNITGTVAFLPYGPSGGGWEWAF